MSNGRHIEDAQAEIVPATQPSIMGMLQVAVEKLGGEGAPAMVEALTKLVDLHERMEAKRAEMSFNLALAAFQAECPSIPKSSTAKVTTSGGAGFSYNYAEIDQIAETTRPLLSKHGLAYSWDMTQTGESITCVCTLRHVDGHRVESTFACPTDSRAAMSGAQKSGAALTYAKRQSLIAVLGLTTCDPDTDGAVNGHARITNEQARNIEALLSEVKADVPGFLKYMGAERIVDISTADYRKAITALESKRRRVA